MVLFVVLVAHSAQICPSWNVDISTFCLLSLSKMVLILFGVWIWLTVVYSFDPTEVDYCKTPCIDKPGHYTTHTACGCELAPGHTEILDNLVEFREKMVQLHNQYRNEIAKGAEAAKGFPSASNMMAVSYDLEVEYIARCYARRATTDNDKCRKPKQYHDAGQNMYFSSRIDLDADPVAQWYSEIREVKGDKKSYLRDYHFNWQSGHFTQVVWATTSVVGCARVWAENVPATPFIIICNYAGHLVSGNARSASIYEAGAPCSKCSNGCNKRYSALCGDIKAVPTSDPFKNNTDFAKNKTVTTQRPSGEKVKSSGSYHKESSFGSRILVAFFVAANLLYF